MNAFESAIYSILDTIIVSDTSLMIFLLGGFVLCPIFSSLALWKRIPRKGIVFLSGILPPVVLGYSVYFNLLVQGREWNDLLPVSPILIAVIGPLISLKKTKREEGKTRASTIINILLLVAQVWAILALWLATNSGFMGANC